MKISTKGRYGLLAMLDLAIHSTLEHVSLNSIAERQHISANYLEQVFSALRKTGLVKSIKGAQGGYILGDSPDKISVGQILRVLEGNLFQAAEEDEFYTEGDNMAYCLKLEVWDRIQANINGLVDSIMLGDLINQYNKFKGNSSYMYHI